MQADTTSKTSSTLDESLASGEPPQVFLENQRQRCKAKPQQVSLEKSCCKQPELESNKLDSTPPNPRATLGAKIFFTCAFALSLGLIVWLYYAFLYTIIIAALLCIATYWIKEFFYTKLKSNLLASGLSVLVLLALFIIPLYFVIHRGALGLLGVDWKQAEVWFVQIKELIRSALHYLPFIQAQDVLANFSFSSIAGFVSRLSTIVGKSSVGFVVDACFIVLFLSVFFYYGGAWYGYFCKLLPARDEQIDLIAADVSGVLRVVFFSTILNVCLQGFAFGLLASVFGLDGVLLGVLYGLCSLIPIVGGALVWLPVGLILYVQGEIVQAVVLVLYSVVFIGFIIDNIVKPFLIRIVNRKLLDKPLNINEFVIFFAIFAGLSACGFWGIIIGPAITAFFIVMVRIYERDFASM
ncbi:AI-2E family transporter [Helicobacter canis]|uniref:AI-2E family transporter n=1 Tax=Helicobacter canis TaxID=29419 RepID=A0A5M9QMT1_9HELI|nr:AI-2E family transporter [Helicobacter canis]KAA8710023.1 AI-2E family transporter [Helicobacter canis]